MGYLHHENGLYIPLYAQDCPLPVRRANRPQHDEALQRERLSGVQWPARLWQIRRAWQMGPQSTLSYLRRLQRSGLLMVHEGVYYLSSATSPNPAEVPMAPPCPRPPKTQEAQQSPPETEPYLYEQRLQQLQWPVTVQEAAAVWKVTPVTAAQALSRMAKKGLIRRSRRGQYVMAQKYPTQEEQ